MGIVVRIGSADIDDVAFRCLFDHRFRLEFPYPYIVKRNIVVHIRVINQTVVSDNLDSFFMRFFHNRRCSFSIVGNNDKNVYSLRY
ncbi:hypothetical protein D3C76_1520640 [compost metagenome]